MALQSILDTNPKPPAATAHLGTSSAPKAALAKPAAFDASQEAIGALIRTAVTSCSNSKPFRREFYVKCSPTLDSNKQVHPPGSDKVSVMPAVAVTCNLKI